MTFFQYRCPSCGDVAETMTRQPSVCLRCDTAMRRLWGFNYKAPMAAHWNTTTGSYISNEADFRDTLKRQSEKASEETGMEHRFEPVDIQDRKGLGVTDEGLDATRQRARDAGKVGPEKGRRIIV